MESRIWVMTPAIGEAFFEQCLYREAVKDEERLAILEEMAQAHQLEVFSSTSSKEEIVASLSKHCNLWQISKDRKAAQ